MRARLRDLVYRHATRILTAPLSSALRGSAQDFEQLVHHVRKGDVVLVCGDQRISEVIRYLTQSSWSHSAIYVGDELLRHSPERARELEERFGDDARHLIVEALVGEGVVVSPITKYRGFHVRLCRPFGLHPADLRTVMDCVLDQLGGEYDVANLIDLARYFLPVSVVPARLRREALAFGSGRPTEVICSSMIARAFDAVGFPILPRTAEDDGTQAGARPADQDRRAEPAGPNGAVAELARERNRVAPKRPPYYAGVAEPTWPSRRPLARHLRMSERPIGLITPRDFDLSPYFEIVKFSLIQGTREDVNPAAAGLAAEPRASVARRAVAALPLWRRLRRPPPAEPATASVARA